MPSVTIRRLDAVQRWPVWKYAPLTATDTAVARSASSSTMSGFLPPISSCTRVPFFIAATPMPTPMSCDPVKLTASTSGDEVERRADLRARPHHQVEHAWRQPGALQDVDERPRRGGRELGRLEDDAVAERERGRNLPGRNREREVPRRDDADDADRLARDLDFDAGPHRVELVAADAHRLAGEVLEDRAGAAGFADPVGERLSLLARQLPPELFLARQDLGAGAVEDVEPLLRGRQRPFGEGLLRRRDGLLDVGGCPARELADDVADVRGVDIRSAVGRIDGLAVDEVRERGGHGRYHFSPRDELASRSAASPLRPKLVNFQRGEEHQRSAAVVRRP